MVLKNQNDYHEFIVNDGCLIPDLLHPHDDPVDLEYSIARVKYGVTTIKHRLKYSDVYYILSGPGRIHFIDESRTAASDNVIFIPPNAI
jgi:mannose-6-phosphate isomerase-like protein (cupin superfamily)